MQSWGTWIIGAWVALTMAVGTASAVDAHADRRAGPAPIGVIPQIPVPVPSSSDDASPTSTTVAPAAPTSITAPDAGIDSTVVAVGKTDDGALAVPDFGTAGWYELGARPGRPGSAVIAGHVDSTDGPDVFHGLSRLEPGDQITVGMGDGTTVSFVVEGREVVDKDHLPVERVFADSMQRRLTLITCGGAFDASARSYEANVIVYARASGRPTAAPSASVDQSATVNTGLATSPKLRSTPSNS